MSKTLLIAGYGPGISAAVAEKFAAEGFQIAIVARNKEKLDEGAKALEAKGVKATPFTADLSNPTAVRDVVERVRAALGPITVIEWTAYAPGNLAADFLTASIDDIRSVFDVAVCGVIAAVQAALPDLKSEKGAVLVTNGGSGLVDPGLDAMLVNNNRMGMGLANAAKHKLMGLLAKKLEADGVYACEMLISGPVKGGPFHSGQGPSIDSKAVADRYWELYKERKEVRCTIKAS